MGAVKCGTGRRPAVRLAWLLRFQGRIECVQIAQHCRTEVAREPDRRDGKRDSRRDAASDECRDRLVPNQVEVAPFGREERDERNAHPEHHCRIGDGCAGDGEEHTDRHDDEGPDNVVRDACRDSDAGGGSKDRGGEPDPRSPGRRLGRSGDDDVRGPRHKEALLVSQRFGDQARQQGRDGGLYRQHHCGRNACVQQVGASRLVCAAAAPAGSAALGGPTTWSPILLPARLTGRRGGLPRLWSGLPERSPADDAVYHRPVGAVVVAS